MAYKKRYRSSPYKRKSRRGKYSRRTRGRSFQSRVKKVLMKASETKYFDIGIENNQLYHNLGFGTSLIPPTTVSSIPSWFNPWSRMSQGTQRFNRIGDKITPRGMSLKFWIANKLDRPNLLYRIIVAILPKIFNTEITTAVFDPFQIPNSGLVGNHMLRHADRDKGVRFLYDRVFSVEKGFSAIAGGGGKESHLYKKLWIKRKRSSPIVYDTTSVDIVNKPIAIYVLPYDSYGTLTTDNIASVAGFMRMYYKDI